MSVIKMWQLFIPLSRIFASIDLISADSRCNPTHKPDWVPPSPTCMRRNPTNPDDSESTSDEPLSIQEATVYLSETIGELWWMCYKSLSPPTYNRIEVHMINLFFGYNNQTTNWPIVVSEMSRHCRANGASMGRRHIEILAFENHAARLFADIRYYEIGAASDHRRVRGCVAWGWAFMHARTSRNRDSRILGGQ
jgi:hypothetical protein